MVDYRIIKETYDNGKVLYAIEKKNTFFGRVIRDWRPELVFGSELKFDNLEDAMLHVGATHEDVMKMVGRETVYDSSNKI